MSISHKPRKRFGQNFLQSPQVIQRIVDAFNPQASDQVLEIGPGTGAITTPLLARLAHLQVLELDRDLITDLKKRSEYPNKLTIYESDVLKFDLNQVSKSPIRIIGNLPYNISTPLIFHLIQFNHIIEDMLFMLQKEVVERLIAEPGDKHYGRLSVMAQCHFKIESLFNVSADCFYPVPKVESAICRLVPVDGFRRQIDNPDAFAQVVQSAFNQRRKTLRNALQSLLNEDEIVQAGINSKYRAERLSLMDYIKLGNILANK